MKIDWLKFAPALSLCVAVWAAALPYAQAQLLDNPDWKESEAPPPPKFDLNKLLTFEVSPNSALVFGVDPASVTISQSDGLLRYVMVARGPGGASNVMYEALRCSTGEFKTYARLTPEGKWQANPNSQWQSVFANVPSKHALRFAKAGACDGAAPAMSVDELTRKLKRPDLAIPRD
jgi:CNP1-like family